MVDGLPIVFQERVIVGDLVGDAEKHAVAEREHARLVNDRDLASALMTGQFKRMANDPLRRVAGDETQAFDHARDNVMFQPRVKPFGIFTHHDQIDIRVRYFDPGQRPHGTDAGEQFQVTPQPDVYRTETLADRRRAGALEGHAMLANQVEREVGQRIAELLDRVETGKRLDPLDASAGGVHHLAGGGHHFRADAVTGDHHHRGRHDFFSRGMAKPAGFVLKNRSITLRPTPRFPAASRSGT